MMTKYLYVTKTTNKNVAIELYDVGFLIKSLDNSVYSKLIRENIEVELDNSDFKFFDISKTGDRFETKVCDRCFKLLKTSEYFSGNRIKKDNVVTNRPSCKNCRKIKDGKSVSKTERDAWDKKKPTNYSLFTCPICTKTTIAGLSKIVLDHNHHTGEVRGFLCESCNTGIGRFDDNPSQIERALIWLGQTKKSK